MKEPTTATMDIQPNICRTCLTKLSPNKCLRLFSSQHFYKDNPLYKVFEEVTHTLMNPHELLPNSICFKCAVKLRQVIAFKRTLERADKLLWSKLRLAEMRYYLKSAKSRAQTFNDLCGELSQLEDDYTDFSDFTKQNVETKDCMKKRSVDMEKLKSRKTKIDDVTHELPEILPEKVVLNVKCLNVNVENNRKIEVPTKKRYEVTCKKLATLIETRRDKYVSQPDDSSVIREIVKSDKSQSIILIEDDMSTAESQDDDVIIIDDDIDLPNISKKLMTSVTLQSPLANKKTNSNVQFAAENISSFGVSDYDGVFERELNLIKSTILADPNIYTLDQEKPVRCLQCDKRFTNINFLQRHLLYHSLSIEPVQVPSEKTNPATIENPISQNSDPPMPSRIELEQPFQLNTIQNIVKPAVPLKLTTKMCQYCQENVLEHTLRRHILTNHRELHRKLSLAEKRRLRKLRYQCNICKKGHASEKLLRRHMYIQHIPKFACDHCEMKFLKKHEMETHVATVHGLKVQSLCYICGKLFSNETIGYHIRSHTSTKSIKCNFSGCTALLKYKNSLIKHIKCVHENERPYVCDRCGKAYALAGGLRQHLRGHSNVFPFKCDLCEKPFALMSQLKIHFNTHLNEKPHKCPVCPQVFARKTSIKKHCNTYHPEHSSAQNPNAPMRRRNLATHEKNFDCRFCQNRKFAHKYNLIKHTRTFHPNIYYNLQQFRSIVDNVEDDTF